MGNRSQEIVRKSLHFLINNPSLQNLAQIEALKADLDVLLYKRGWVDGKPDTTTAEDIHQNGRTIEFNPTVSDITPWSTYDYPVPKFLGKQFEKHTFLDDHVQEELRT